MPILIKNNANVKIKRFCLFVDDNAENKICQSEVIFKDIELKKDSEYKVYSNFNIR
jgi:hypothetical protein